MINLQDKSRDEETSRDKRSTLAKMGKGEPVAMDNLAKICAALQHSLFNVTDVSENNSCCNIKPTKHHISNATIRNWGKLHTQSTGRLTTRANKRKSKKRILPAEYISDKDNVAFIQTTLDYIDENSTDIMSAIFSLGINLLKKKNIYEKPHVTSVLDEYTDIEIIDDLSSTDLPTNEFDI